MTQRNPLRGLEALVDELAESAGERPLMSGALQLLAYAAADAAPGPNLKSRVLDRIREEQAGRGPTFVDNVSYFARSNEIEWTPVVPGIWMKMLYKDERTGAETSLWRVDPETPFPAHAHEADEDVFLISGNAWVGNVPMRAGDYCRAAAGTEHNDIRSGSDGALAVRVSR